MSTDGLCSMIIPQRDDATVEEVMTDTTALRLINRGAKLYLMADGKTNVLAIKPPEGAFARAWGLGGRGLGGQPCAA